MVLLPAKRLHQLKKHGQILRIISLMLILLSSMFEVIQCVDHHYIEELSTEITAIRNDLMNSIHSLAIAEEEASSNETISTVAHNSLSMSVSTSNQTNDALLAAIQSLQNQIY